MIGDTVSHYRILGKLGHGGMGVVYRALDTRLGRYVAVKFIGVQQSQEADALDRFQREARAASALTHPHICAVFDVGRHGDLPFLVMELLDGQTLHDLIAGTPLPLDQQLDLACQVADALDYAHSLGIVHRDIKTSNIVVTGRGHVKVLDFGLAKLQQRLQGTDPYGETVVEARTQHTATGALVGTLSSMSPEQARGEEVDARTDLFSIGVVLYQMATGREPFGGKTPALTFDAILHRSPEPPSTINPQVPRELDQIIAKTLEKDRTARYQKAAQLRTDLTRLRRISDQAIPIVSVDETRAFTVPPPAPAPRLRRWYQSILLPVGLVAVLALGGLTYWLTRGGGGPTQIESVAVLPFGVTGATTENEYLTDGITETLINSLTQLPDLRVSARSVVFRFKGRNVDPTQAARDLNVNAVVAGRVTVRGDRLVIQADLVRPDGTQLWGNQYNVAATGLLEVQDTIAREILDKLRPRLTGDEKELATRRHTDDVAAYQLYLQGRFHWNKGTIAGYRQAIEYFQMAIAKDPKYALAYAGLADSQLLLGSYWVESITEAKAAAERALALDPTLAEAHIAVAHIKLWLDWDWPAAERAFSAGLKLSPASALAHQQYARYLATLGQAANAIAETRRALDLDPLSAVINGDLAWHLFYAGRRAEAIAQFRKALEFDANSVSAYQGLGMALSDDARHAEAVSALTRAYELSEKSPVMLGPLGAANARWRGQAAADEAIKSLEAQSSKQYVPASAFALIYAAMDDRPRAIDALEKAFEEHDFSMVLINVMPWYQTLRSDARFQALLTKLGLPSVPR